MSEKIIQTAKELCEKFINKVETGKARSRETYADCIELLKIINARQLPRPKDVDEKQRCHVCKVEVGEKHLPFCSVGNDVFRR